MTCEHTLPSDMGYNSGPPVSEKDRVIAKYGTSPAFVGGYTDETLRQTEQHLKSALGAIDRLIALRKQVARDEALKHMTEFDQLRLDRIAEEDQLKWDAKDD